MGAAAPAARSAMNRLSGLYVFLVLVVLTAGLRFTVAQGRSERILRGEARAVATLGALAEASRAALAGGGPHPGLAAIARSRPGLELLDELSRDDRSYARDEVYLYGLAPTSHRAEDSEEIAHGFILRAWPREFGITGDTELYVTEDGALWQSQNRLGRSGTTQGFPPPFPDPMIGEERSPWWRRTPQR